MKMKLYRYGFLFYLYGLIGWSIEIAFTCFANIISGQGDWRLEGHSYLWMFPIWAIGIFAFQLISNKIQPLHIILRALIYALLFMSIEYTTGYMIKSMVDIIPWDYSEALLNINGLIRLDYMPFWAIAGLIGEKTLPFLNKIRQI